VHNSSAYFVLGVLVLFAVLTSVAWHFYRRSRRSSRVNWEDLVQRLIWVDPKVVEQIALDLLNHSGQIEENPDEERLDPTRIFSMIGGLKGLEDLKTNGQVMIEMAAYLQQSYPEALLVAEELRLYARELDWHVGRLEGAAKTGNLEISFPFYAKRAIATYYRMSRQLLALYQEKDLPVFAELQKAL